MTTATPNPKPITAYCRVCGKPLTEDDARPAQGTIFCAEHVPAAGQATTPRPTGASPHGASPGLAFLLGLIPGVGAIYNGQYAKGLVHAVIWGVLMSIADSNAVHGMEPVFVMLVIAWWAYMALEAHHTARRLQMGEPVDEYSSLLDLRGGPGRFPVAGIALILLGVLLLLHTLNLLDFEYVVRYWPVLLIVAGVYLLWSRFSSHEAAPREMRHER